MGEVLGNSMDMRGGQSKKSDEAGKGIKDMGRSEFFFLFCFRHFAMLIRILLRQAREPLFRALRSMPMIRLLTRKLERRIIWIWDSGNRLDL
jgi:hypothetical protein